MIVLLQETWSLISFNFLEPGVNRWQMTLINQDLALRDLPILKSCGFIYHIV